MCLEKNSKKNLHSTILLVYDKYKIMLWKLFCAPSKNRTMQIRAMRNPASWGMTVPQVEKLIGPVTSGSTILNLACPIDNVLQMPNLNP